MLEETRMVANELENKGFKALVYNNIIEVSLSSRKVARLEVKHVLDEEFEGIEFILENTWNGVKVTV